MLYTIKQETSKKITIKKSIFIATVSPIQKLNQTNKRIDEIKGKFSNATHYPYALRIGHERIEERFSDEGEPPKSAGLPILQELKKANLTNTILVVTRYFGGIKLGLGGLNRAYRESAALVIVRVRKEVFFPTIRFLLHIDRTYIGKLRNILEHFNTKIIQENYVGIPEYTVEINKEQKDGFLEAIKTVTKGTISIKEIPN